MRNGSCPNHGAREPSTARPAHRHILASFHYVFLVLSLVSVAVIVYAMINREEPERVRAAVTARALPLLDFRKEVLQMERCLTSASAGGASADMGRSLAGAAKHERAARDALKALIFDHSLATDYHNRLVDLQQRLVSCYAKGRHAAELCLAGRHEAARRHARDFEADAEQLTQCVNELVKAEQQSLHSRLSAMNRRTDAIVYLTTLTLLSFMVVGFVSRHMNRRYTARLSREIADRQQAEQALRQREENLRITLHSIGEAVIVTDTDGTVVRVNRVAEQLLGRNRDETVGRPLSSVLRIVDAQTREPIENPAQKVLDSGEVAGRPPHGLLLITDDGERRIAESGAPIRDSQGRTTGVVLVFRDVTEEVALEEQFRQSQKMEAVGRLAGGIAHDFNNQLTIINGYCELQLGELAPDDPTAETLRQILQAGERSRKLASQLLAFSRRQAIQAKVIDLRDVVSSLQKPLARMLGEDIELECVARGGPARVYADGGQVEQALMNLAVNARDAMPEGGRLTIETSEADLGPDYTARHPEAPPGTYAVLSVSDTGTGIDEQTLERVFEPFFTTKDVGEGTGLGLSMVYGFVKQSNGSIDVASRPGQGTSFRIYLPLAAETPQQAEPDEATAAPRGDETVLIAEDEEGVRQLMVRVLRGCGYTVLETGNAEEALPLGEHYERPIHLLLADIVMPGMLGPELADRLQRTRPDMKVLFISGYAERPDDAYPLREDDVLLAKPFSPEALAREVRRVLDAAPGRQPAETGAAAPARS
jgi:hypothetical protein